MRASRVRASVAALAAAVTLSLAACSEEQEAKSETPPATTNTHAAAPAGTDPEAAEAAEITLSEKDIVVGSADAPVTMIEYASVTCSHCAQFHAETYPKLKEAYIDTGKVRFVFREFPTSPAELAGAGFLLARCAGPERYMHIVSALMARQRDWVFNPDPQARLAAFSSIAGQAGIGQEKLKACLSDQEALAHISAVQREGATLYGVDSTPSFIIDGQKYPGARSFEKFQEILDPLLAQAAPAETKTE